MGWAAAGGSADWSAAGSAAGAEVAGGAAAAYGEHSGDDGLSAILADLLPPAPPAAGEAARAVAEQPAVAPGDAATLRAGAIAVATIPTAGAAAAAAAASACAGQGPGSSAAGEAEDCLLCCACMERRKTHAVVPCGHLCLCAGCCKRLAAAARAAGREPECPICRGAVAMTMRVHS